MKVFKSGYFILSIFFLCCSVLVAATLVQAGNCMTCSANRTCGTGSETCAKVSQDGKWVGQKIFNVTDKDYKKCFEDGAEEDNCVNDKSKTCGTIYTYPNAGGACTGLYVITQLSYSACEL